MEAIQKEYCPPLDEALFFALVSDYDLQDQSQVAQLRALLDGLKEGAEEEQELELLPVLEYKNSQLKPGAASYAGHSLVSTGGSSQPSESNAQSVTDEDGVTSITTGISAAGLSETGSEIYEHERSGYGETGQAVEDLPDEKKIEWLSVMFPSVKEEDIKNVLAKCEGKFDQSTDELLNLSFLHEDGDHARQDHSFPVIKGVDGFASSDNERQVRRKGKGKNRRKGIRTDIDDSEWHSESARSSGTATPDLNVWASVPTDIQFIALRTGLKPKSIASIYHANGARLAPTIRALVVKEGGLYARNPEKVDEPMHFQIEELKFEFEAVPNAQIYGALMLTNNHPSAAKEMLEAMIASKDEPTLLGKVDGLASYAPIDLSDGESEIKKAAATYGSQPYGSGVHTITHMGNPHGLAASQAFQQASTAYRRGKSDRLMGGAAAYYASIGHDHIRAAKAMQVHEANAFVARQSTATTLDLHGVNVSQAVRIAQEGTERWWEELGDRKYAPVGGVGNGFKIVTGVGRHSSDGIGRIGPAVSKMLVREGWKIEVARGEVIVWGRARKK